jgi:hypothetical protein
MSSYRAAADRAARAAKDATGLWVRFISHYMGESDYEVQEHGTTNKRRVRVMDDGAPVEGIHAPNDIEARAVAVYLATLEGA